MYHCQSVRNKNLCLISYVLCTTTENKVIGIVTSIVVDWHSFDAYPDPDPY
jgi:hypothetical protein